MNEKESAARYQRAAEEGDSDGMYHLGKCLAEGEGVDEDLASAVSWYLRAAEKGHAGAMVRLGVSYATGTGVAIDSSMASNWFRKAAALVGGGALAWADDEVACFAFAEMYANGDGVQRDEALAAELYAQVAEDFDNVDAMRRLAACYNEGRGVEKNDGEAIHWYCEAAKRNDVGARDWLSRAAEAGNVGAMYHLASFFGDSDEAVAWLSKAADRGHKRANEELEAGARRGDNRMARILAEYSNYSEAIHWYRQVAGSLRKMAETGAPGTLFALSLVLHNWASRLERGAYPEEGEQSASVLENLESMTDEDERREEADLLQFESEQLMNRAIDLGYPDALDVEELRAQVIQLRRKHYERELAVWKLISPDVREVQQPVMKTGFVNESEVGRYPVGGYRHLKTGRELWRALRAAGAAVPEAVETLVRSPIQDPALIGEAKALWREKMLEY